MCIRDRLEKALNDIGLMKVFDHLLAYTRQKMKGLFWQHKKQNGVATKGQEAHDFVNEAVRLALDLREKRKWKPDKEPDPLNHLASVINSAEFVASCSTFLSIVQTVNSIRLPSGSWMTLS